MGLSLIFGAGKTADDTKKMLDALEAADYQSLDKLMAQKSDFSLHLVPRDLQTLSECAAVFSSAQTAPFREGLTCYFDAEDRGFFIVSEEWEEYIASIDPKNAKPLAEAWFQAMETNYQESVGKPTPASVTAIEDLLALCKYARQTGNPVVHIWIA